MTDPDNIELPPLPPFSIAPIADKQTVRDYARAAVLADRERRAEPAKPAKPKVFQRKLGCFSDGRLHDYSLTPGFPNPSTGSAPAVTLCWTDDGRAWIDSERNRELAADVRHWPTRPDDFIAKLADALDGGVR